MMLQKIEIRCLDAGLYMASLPYGEWTVKRWAWVENGWALHASANYTPGDPKELCRWTVTHLASSCSAGNMHRRRDDAIATFRAVQQLHIGSTPVADAPICEIMAAMPLLRKQFGELVGRPAREVDRDIDARVADYFACHDVGAGIGAAA